MNHDSIARATRGLSALSAALILALASPASGQEAPTGSWAREADSESPFSQGGMVSDGTYLYVIGGYQALPGEPNAYGKVRRYDPASNTWISLAEMAVPVINSTAAYLDGRIYSPGGFVPDPDPRIPGSAIAAIQAYDIATDTWSALSSSLSVPREGHAAATLGNRIYITGGYSDRIHDLTEEFDPATGTVTVKAPMPAALLIHTLTAVPELNRLYAISGTLGFALSYATYEYDPATDAWTTKAEWRDSDGQLQARMAAGSFSLLGRVYITGGEFSGSKNTTWEYTPESDTWTRRADMIFQRRSHGAAAIGERGYVFGGFEDFGLESTISSEEFTAPSNEPPIADAGMDRTVECTSPSGAAVVLDGSASTDPDAGDTLSYSWSGPFGTQNGISVTVTLPLGANSVSLTVTDAAGESSADTVVITVVDTTPPTINSLTADPATLWSPNGQMRAVEIAVNAEDAGDPAPVAEIVSVSSNQAVGNDSDWEVTGTLSLNLRAERTGGETRIYTITVRCTDASGNSSVDTVTVTVPHNQAGN